MRFFHVASSLTLCLTFSSSVAYGLSGIEIPTGRAAGGGSSLTTDRRALLAGLVTTATAAAVTLGWQRPAHATTTTSSLVQAPASELQDVYFGVGCFWHIMHEFVQAERERLGRNDHELTSKAGYAGGTKTGEDGKVCYHNFQRMADYGALGHGEVVAMTIPSSEIVPFTEYYFSLFSPRTKDRVDPQDRGAEYRSLLGLPGGTKHTAYPEMEAVAKKAGFTLVAGKGNDPDTLGQQIVYVYDTSKFPFYQAEVYHQYHNDFQSPPYGKAYNSLADLALDEGRLKITGCPDRV